jgi:tetratricopeptide (TPR) repeat protein
MEPETVEDVLALIEKQPADAELYQRLGQLYSKEGRSEEARRAFEQSLELDPKDAFTHLYLGNWFYGCRMYPEALARFQHAAELLPDEAVAYWCQGDVYRSQGRYHMAQQAYEAAVHVAPDDQQACEKLAAWHGCRRGTTDQTRGMIRVAYRNDQAATTVLLASRWLQAHPADLGVIHDYATMLYQMTRYEEAIRVYLDAIERFEDGRWGLYNQMGHLHRYRGDFAVAELWYQKAVDEDPGEVASYVFLGAVQARQGKLTQAEETHRRGTQCPNGPVDEAYHNLGLVLRGQGRLAEAANCFRKAIELCSEYADAIEALQDVEAALALSIGDEAEPAAPQTAGACRLSVIDSSPSPRGC